MITEELEHNIGIHRTLSSVESRDEIRRELKQQVDKYLASGGRIEEIPINVSAEDHRRFFNNQGALNPQKYRSKDWASGGLNGKSQAQ